MKNAYAKIVLHEMKHTTADAHLVGPTAIAYTSAEAGPVAKILFAAMKETPLQVKGALIGGELFGKEQTEAYSKLPTRLEMISILMNTMNGVTSKLVRTLAAVADQKAGK
jgi:large subunit ribosomal protein L10